MEWQPIETAPENEVVLTQHKNDLYPVAAVRIIDLWYREVEGPEDIFEAGNGRLGALYRTPTHWMPLPPPPDNG